MLKKRGPLLDNVERKDDRPGRFIRWRIIAARFGVAAGSQENFTFDSPRMIGFIATSAP
jgi:hypothetical protein